MKVPSFKDYYLSVKHLESYLEKSKTLDDFYMLVENDQSLELENVMTGNFAGITMPLATIARNTPTSMIYEHPPKNEKATDFISKYSSVFKNRYGFLWEKVMNSTAWKLFPDPNACYFADYKG